MCFQTGLFAIGLFVTPGGLTVVELFCFHLARRDNQPAGRQGPRILNAVTSASLGGAAWQVWARAMGTGVTHASFRSLKTKRTKQHPTNSEHHFTEELPRTIKME